MIKILDCTLRDGGYYNDWDFPIEIVNKYIDAMSKSNVDIVEIGFRSLKITTPKGGLAFSTDNYLSKINIPLNIKIAVMVNASELLSSELSLSAQIDKLFPKNSNVSKVKIVRIACHINEFLDALKVASLIKNKGFEVAFNIMQFSEINKETIISFCKSANKKPIDILYFADSLGALNPTQIIEFVKIIKQNWKREIGIHTHNNLGLALENSLTALREGVSYLDCTVTGMGRGPGNAKTEELLYETQSIRKTKYNYYSLSNLISSYFKPLQKKLDWGENFFYYLAGKKKIHPTYIQEILNNPSYSNNDILAVIDYLSNIDSKTYKSNKFEDILSSYFKKQPKKSKEIKLPKKNKILILGSGNSIIKYKEIIENYISNSDIFVISPNTYTILNQNLINLRIACHPIRIISDLDKYEKLKQPLVIPLSMLKNFDNDKLKLPVIHDYSISLNNDALAGGKLFATIPNYNVLGYSLAVCLKMKAKYIEMVGFDGFDISDFRQKEVQGIIDIFERDYSKINLVSLTPSNYSIKYKSIFSY